MLELRLQRSYPAFTLDLSLDLPGRRVTALFGPSGCGKTSTLRAIAGLERATYGRVALHGEVWQDDATGQRFVPTHQRAIGYVFQEPSLLAHLSVQGNLDFGLQRVPPAQRRVSLERAVELLGIAALLARRPATLSGGERQRVAIARALASSPRLLLMDEPLAALDAQRKAEVLPYLERLAGELDIPILYVSHAIDEVARLADHLVLMEAGRVVASGATPSLLTRLDLSLAHGDSAAAVLSATVCAHDARFGLSHAEFAGGRIALAHPDLPLGLALRRRVQARDVSLTLQQQTGTSILNILPATVTALADDGRGQVMVQLDLGGSALLARVTAKSVHVLQLAPGLALYAQIKGVAILG
jgi:molybdate transport system ATP-binding protein